MALRALPSCGSKTGIAPPAAGIHANEPDAFFPSGDDGGALAVDLSDPCPSAVSGSKPMIGNCSTRDGRARVSAPIAPRLKWAILLPSPMASLSQLATDATGHAYVVAAAQAPGTSWFGRVRLSDGTVEWAGQIAAVQPTEVPIVLSSGPVDLCSSGGQDSIDALLTFAPQTGASTSTTFGLDLSNSPGNFAVGADGSAYVTHVEGGGTSHQTTLISRVSPGGVVLWTSVDLATLGPPPVADLDNQVFLRSSPSGMVASSSFSSTSSRRWGT